MPDFPFADAHVVLSDSRRFAMPRLGEGYGWDDRLDGLQKPMNLAEYTEDTRGVPIDTMVLLEAGVLPAYALLETLWMASLARIDRRVRAVVTWAPVPDGVRARAFLEAAKGASPLVVGARYGLELLPEETGLKPGFLDGLKLLAEFDLSFELGIKQHHLPAAMDMVSRNPGLRFMVNHIAKPDMRHKKWERWWEDIAAMAALPNVWCKVSGAVTEADLDHWTAADLKPCISRVFEVFGEDRVVYGGDWPVVRLAAGGYKRWVEALHAMTMELSPAAKRKFWSDNAKAFYRIGQPE
jgi:L-fuconolactonase